MLRDFINFYSRVITTISIGLLFTSNVGANTLTMDIIGHIKDRCEINLPSGNVMKFEEQNAQIIPFDLYCNRPLGISINSMYGGLKHQQQGINLIEKYNLTLQIDSLQIDVSRNSSQLLIPTIIEDSSGVIPFSQQGILSVALEKNLLFAGHYQDVIEIEVYPSIHSVAP